MLISWDIIQLINGLGILGASYRFSMSSFLFFVFVSFQYDFCWAHLMKDIYQKLQLYFLFSTIFSYSKNVHILFSCLCKSVSVACMCACVSCACNQCLRGSEGCIKSLGTLVTDRWKPPCECSKSKPGLLRGQPVLSTDEPPPQVQIILFWTIWLLPTRSKLAITQLNEN